jgi:hypothetical protein
VTDQPVETVICRICSDPCPPEWKEQWRGEQVCCSDHLEDLITMGWTVNRDWCVDPACTECDRPDDDQGTGHGTFIDLT